MKLLHANASFFVPDGMAGDKALQRTTHLGIGAHQDDLEIMAFHGIATCYGKTDTWFGGITCTDGAGSPRAGLSSNLSPRELALVRKKEQEDAATIGRYGFVAQLGYSSAQARALDGALVEDLASLIETAAPDVIYTHSPADRHPTHIGICKATLAAIRRLPKSNKPEKVFGCEVWGDLDWLPEGFKVVLDVSGHNDLARKLLQAFPSQVSGNKRYDLGAIGRRQANATFLNAGAPDQMEQAIYAMDLTALTGENAIGIEEFMEQIVRAFSAEITAGLRPS